MLKNKISHRSITLASIALLATLALTSALNLQCDYIRSGWYVVGEVKNCYARKLDIRADNVLISSVSEDSSGVKGFWIENEVCHYLPKNIAEFFPHLTAIGAENSGLRLITKQDLAPFPDLLRFAFYRNELEYLESDLFMYNKKLQSISLTDNNLMIVGENILEPLRQLSYAQIEIRCLKKKCENSMCITSLTGEIRNHCQSDSIIVDFKTKIQKLQYELKLAEKSCNVENLIDARLSKAR